MEVWECAVRELCSMPALLWLAIQDKRHLGVTRKSLVAAAILLLAAGCFETVTWESRLGGVMIGAVLLLFGYFSKEAIGFADGILILVCGAAFGLYETAMLCFFATVYAGSCSVVLLIAGRVGKKSRIPFVPFVLLGYITMRLFLCSV